MDEDRSNHRPFVPFRAKVVERISLLSKEERLAKIESAGFDVMKLDADDVFIDLVTDTGMSALSTVQCGNMLMSDESYVRSRSYKRLESVVQEIFGFPYVTVVHQGRGGQNIFDHLLLKPGMVVPGNTHFSVVENLIRERGGIPVDCKVAYCKNEGFNGNIDLNMLEKTIDEYSADKVAYILITATCNIKAGEPVSMKNIKEVCEIARKRGIRTCIDGARFAENAYAIKRLEKEYASKSVREIVKEMFSYADACIISAKKDALAPTGGFLCVRNKDLHQKLKPIQYMIEGYPTNGGLSGSTMDAIAFGLQEATDNLHCKHRYEQINRLGQMAKAAGVSVFEPFGCHGIVIDVGQCLKNVPSAQYAAHFLAVEIYKEGGVRVVPYRKDNPSDPELIYNSCVLAVPRRLYFLEHFEYVVSVIGTVVRRNLNATKGLQLLSLEDGSRAFAYVK